MASKAAKKRILVCQEKAQKIVGILSTKKGHFDITDLTTTLKFAVNIFTDFLNTKGKERPVVTDDGEKIEQSLNELDDILNKNSVLRFFMRRKLDQLNAQLHKEVAQIYLGLQANKKKQSVKKGSKKGLKAELENELKHTEIIKDDVARKLWEMSFDQALMVSWSDFMNAFQKEIPLDRETEKQLRYILDNSNTSFLSLYKFADFLQGFGPFRSCVEKVQAVLSAEWFHGFLSSQEAERLLERQPAYTFLIRFSKSKPGSFAIAYVDASQTPTRTTVTHTLIACCPPSGFKIEEAYNDKARGRIFSTLQEVVEFYGYLLRQPFKSDLSRQGWFHGDLTSQEAEEVLASEKDGSFLFRFSSKSGFLAVSYVVGKDVKHGLLESLPGGFKFENQPPLYPTLQDVVNSLSDILKIPLTNLSFDTIKSNANTVGTIGRSGPMAIKQTQNPSQPTNYGPVGVSSQNPNVSATHYAPVAARPASPSPAIAPGQSPPTRRVGSSTFIPGYPQVSTPVPSYSQGSTPPTQDTTYSSMAPKPQSPPQQTYGSMPVPSQHPQQTPPQTIQRSPSSPGAAYGAIPSALPAPNNSTPATSTASGTPNAHYLSFNHPGQNGPASSGIKTPPQSQYGAFPNQHPGRPASMQLPPSHLNNPPPSSVGTSQYGQIPSSPAQRPAPSTQPPSTQPPQPQPSNYGSIPPVQSRPLTTASPAPQGSNYREIPNGQFQLRKSNGNLPAQPNPGGANYGSIPAVRTAPVLPSPQQQPQPTNSTYGAIPQPVPRPRPLSVAPVSSSPLNPSNYGAIPSVASRPQNALAQPVVDGVDYGALPEVVPNRANEPDYSGLPPSSHYANNDILDYGALPATPSDQSDYGGLPDYQANRNPQDNSDYGGLPGGQYQDNPDYGGLPGGQYQDNPDYGGLPDGQYHNPQDNPDYGGLPSGQYPYNNSTTYEQNGFDYGALPTTVANGSNDSDYGGLPVPQDGLYRTGSSENSIDYGALPSPAPAKQPHSNYGTIPNTPRIAVSNHRTRS